MHSKVGLHTELVLDITTYIEAIIISLLYCRSGLWMSLQWSTFICTVFIFLKKFWLVYASGLLFLLHDPELATTVILALKGVDSKKEYSIPLRYASFLISKGFFCPPHEVGIIAETHLRIVSTISFLNSLLAVLLCLICLNLDLKKTLSY